MKPSIALLLFIAFILSNCSNDDITNLTNSNEIIVNDDLYSNAPNDNYQIIQANIVDNSLNVKIEYGGGCGTVNYDLLTPVDYEDTDPVQKNIRLAFHDDDNCEALIELELFFDIAPIQISGNDRIIINLDRWGNQIEYIY